MMCDCFIHEYGYGVYGRCRGTKEVEWCSCAGDTSRCDFYPEKRKGVKQTMNTAEMWLKAQEDGKTYECVDGDMAYSKEMGLVDKYDFDEPWGLEAWREEREDGLNCLMECKWQVMSNVMTVEEAEKKYGIRIIRE